MRENGRGGVVLVNSIFIAAGLHFRFEFKEASHWC